MGRSERKLKRNKTVHNDFKCVCGNHVKWYKEILLFNKKTKMKSFYKNIFWCNGCGRKFIYDNETGKIAEYVPPKQEEPKTTE